MKGDSRRWTVRLFLIAVLIFGALLRLDAIDHDLPYTYNLDEVHFLDPAFNYVLRGDPNPHFFFHPGSTLIYLLSGSLEIYYQGGRMLGDFTGFDGFTEAYHSDPTTVFIIGRVLSVTAAVLSILAVYLIGSRMFSPPAGLLSAFLFSTLPMHVKHSRMIRTDALAIALILLTVLAAIKYLKEGGYWGGLAALLAGLAVATKYSALPVVVTVFISLYFRLVMRRSDGSRTSSPISLALIGLVGLGFFLGAPFAILDWGSAWKDIASQAQVVTVGYPAIPVVPKFCWYLGNILPYASGGIVIPLLSVVGIFFAFKDDRRRTLVFLSFPVLYLILILPPQLRMPRYMLYLLPFVSLLAVRTVFGVMKLITVREKVSTLISVLVVLLLAFFPLRATLRDHRSLAREDIRTTARRWLEENVPEGEGIVYEAACPLLHQMDTGKWRLLNKGNNRIISQSLEFYEKHGYRYVVINRFYRSKVEQNTKRWPKAVQRYKQLEGKEKLKTFRRGSVVIEVYRLY